MTYRYTYMYCIVQSMRKKKKVTGDVAVEMED